MNEGINQPCEPREERFPTPLVERRPNQIRPINIEQLHHGYIVRVGCHSFAIENKSRLIDKLSDYIQEPSLMEKKWFDGELL
jgi:hypothetical protein